jgi:hypothetical protein
MKRILVAAIALGMSVLVAPVANASSADSIYGGCFYDNVSNAGPDGDQYVGVIGDLSVTTDGSGAPTAATVTCWIEVNGVEAPNTRFSYSGSGAQAGTDQTSFTALSTDTVRECQWVSYADGTTSSEPDCPEPIDVVVPPPGTVDTVFRTIGPVLGLVLCADEPCAYVCPRLVPLAGSYGPVTIAPDGDVYVFDPLALGVNPIWDCPPYENF